MWVSGCPVPSAPARLPTLSLPGPGEAGRPGTHRAHRAGPPAFGGARCPRPWEHLHCGRTRGPPEPRSLAWAWAVQGVGRGRPERRPSGSRAPPSLSRLLALPSTQRWPPALTPSLGVPGQCGLWPWGVLPKGSGLAELPLVLVQGHSRSPPALGELLVPKPVLRSRLGAAAHPPPPLLSRPTPAWA